MQTKKDWYLDYLRSLDNKQPIHKRPEGIIGRDEALHSVEVENRYACEGRNYE